MASGHVNRAKQAEHMAAPTNAANVKKPLPTRSRPHMARCGLTGAANAIPLLRFYRTKLKSLPIHTSELMSAEGRRTAGFDPKRKSRRKDTSARSWLQW
jgi:hypothetical protein